MKPRTLWTPKPDFAGYYQVPSSLQHRSRLKTSSEASCTLRPMTRSDFGRSWNAAHRHSSACRAARIRLRSGPPGVTLSLRISRCHGMYKGLELESASISASPGVWVATVVRHEFMCVHPSLHAFVRMGILPSDFSRSVGVMFPARRLSCPCSVCGCGACNLLVYIDMCQVPGWRNTQVLWRPHQQIAWFELARQ